jgi:hypothetical protein
MARKFHVFLQICTSNILSFLLWPLFTPILQVYKVMLHLTILIDTYTIGRAHLGEGSARSKGLYLTKNNIHNKQISMPSEGFETTIPASERPQNHALDRAATGTGTMTVTFTKDRRIQSVPSNLTYWYPF